MRRPVARRALLILSLSLAAGSCAPAGPHFAAAAAGLPPVPAGAARLFVYRWLEPYETMAPTTAYLNGAPVGVSETGSVIYRDVAPGQYTISVDTTGIYPNQFKTVVLRPGETAYVRIESLSSWFQCGGGINEGGGSGCANTFVVNVIDAASALTEMGSLRFIRG